MTSPVESQLDLAGGSTLRWPQNIYAAQLSPFGGEPSYTQNPVKRSYPLSLVLYSLLVGVGLGWGISRYSVGSERFSNRTTGSSAGSGSANYGQPSKPRIRDQESPTSRYTDPAISQMDAQQLHQRLVSLKSVANDPRNSPMEWYDAMFQMHEVALKMRQEEVKTLLSSMRESPDLDPRMWTLTAELSETLLERLMEFDPDGAISWARANGSLSVIARILTRRNPMEAVSFIRDNGVEIDENIAANLNIGRFAVEQGPNELLALEDVLGKRGISDALELIPQGQCESFADAWYDRLEAEPSDQYDLGRILERWGNLAPHEMILWYRSRPNLGNDVQFVCRLMSSLLGNREEIGLDFAEAEFKRAPDMRRQLFTIAVNSNFEPELWRKLAERLPADAKPTILEFSEHLRIGHGPAPEGILAASQCIADAEQRFNYLEGVLQSSKDWASQERGWTQNAIQDARDELQTLELDPQHRTNIIELFDEVVAAAASRDTAPLDP